MAPSPQSNAAEVATLTPEHDPHDMEFKPDGNLIVVSEFSPFSRLDEINLQARRVEPSGARFPLGSYGDVGYDAVTGLTLVILHESFHLRSCPWNVVFSYQNLDSSRQFRLHKGACKGRYVPLVNNRRPAAFSAQLSCR